MKKPLLWLPDHTIVRPPKPNYLPPPAVRSQHIRRIASVPPAEGGGGEGAVTALTFFSDWRNGIGNSEANIRDGTKWQDWYDGRPHLTIESASGKGFPAAIGNCIRFRMKGTDTDAVYVQNFTRWGLPSVGGAIIRRVYYLNALLQNDTGGGDTLHCWEGAVGGCAFFNFTINGTVGTFLLEIRDDLSDHKWRVSLPWNTPLMIEEKYIRVGVDSWKTHARVKDMAGNVIRTNADFDCVAGHGTHTLADNTTNGISDSCIVQHNINWQGSSGAGDGQASDSDDPFENSMYWAGYAVAVVDAAEADLWIEDYPHTDEA